MNKKSYLLLAILNIALTACNGGGGITDYVDNKSTAFPLPPGQQWNSVAPRGVPIVPSGVSPSSQTNNVNIIYDVLNNILYAQHVNANLYPVLLNSTQTPSWQESNPFESQLVNNNVSVTSYLGADASGHIYGFGLQNSIPVLFTFNDTTQTLSVTVLSGVYPSSTQFGNLYYDNGSVYALAQTQSGTIYNYSLVQFNAAAGQYVATINLNYASEHPFVNVYSLPLNNATPFTNQYYLSGALGDGTFYINNNGVATAIPLANALTQSQIGAKFISDSTMFSIGYNPPWAEMSAIAYSQGRLFACGLIPEIPKKYSQTRAILGIASNANTNQVWESIGYTQANVLRDNTIADYAGCMNISAYGNKVFANDNTESDTLHFFPDTAMVYESSF